MMAKQRSTKIRRTGAYIVKAAESRPSRVAAKDGVARSTPNTSDKRLAGALLKVKSA
jgi:hypothetical protein